jgi:hypothetical protein
MSFRVEGISFGEFDPLGTLAQQAHWGTLEPVHGVVTAPPTKLNLEVRERVIILENAAIDLSGANLRFAGTYAWGGALNLNVNADLRRLRRRWLVREDDSKPTAALREVRLGGPIENLAVEPAVEISHSGPRQVDPGTR